MSFSAVSQFRTSMRIAHSEVIFSVPMSEVSLLAKLKITVVNGFSGVDTGQSRYHVCITRLCILSIDFAQ